ncbi:MAG: signal recognition particle-docking protein FtsY, partial [Gammaproteobacteria bacterium]|nr:signal recognition particle-docking protein FtsY [Gammaproteobacteria bacterium]
MFGFGKRKNSTETANAEQEQERGVFSRLKQRLSKTRHKFTDGLGNLLLGKKIINADLLEELEELLILADVGVEATSRIIDDLSGLVKRNELSNPEALSQVLKE